MARQQAPVEQGANDQNRADPTQSARDRTVPSVHRRVAKHHIARHCGDPRSNTHESIVIWITLPIEFAEQRPPGWRQGRCSSREWLEPKGPFGGVRSVVNDEVTGHDGMIRFSSWPARIVSQRIE
jgi:hypothetical protein